MRNVQLKTPYSEASDDAVPLALALPAICRALAIEVAGVIGPGGRAACRLLWRWLLDPGSIPGASTKQLVSVILITSAAGLLELESTVPGILLVTQFGIGAMASSVECLTG